MLTRLGRFTLAVFRPQVYVTYAVAWVLALEGSATVISQGTWRPSWGTAVRAVSVLLALFFLRVVDEQKDLDYDRVHHPDRPLVRGSVRVSDLRAAMAVTALVLAALNRGSGLLVLAFDLGYAVFLLYLERWSPRVRDGLLVNLAVTYPVQLLLSIYVCVSAAVPVNWPLIAVFVLVFLHFEFARKTAWAPASRFYSTLLGPRGSAAVTTLCAAGAAALAVTAGRGWGPVAVLALPAAGAWLFLRRRTKAWPVPLAMGFVIGSYLGLALQAGMS